MVRRSGQMGVPVITVDGEVIVGFDQPRLEHLVSGLAGTQHARLGAAVAQRVEGLLVGRVHSGSPAARAGLQSGDLILAVDGNAVGTVEGLQAALAMLWQRGLAATLAIRRDSRDLRLLVHAA
jgi:S1-C subfamily serine protease